MDRKLKGFWYKEELRNKKYYMCFMIRKKGVKLIRLKFLDSSFILNNRNLLINFNENILYSNYNNNIYFSIKLLSLFI